MAVSDVVYWVWYSQIKGISNAVKLKLIDMMESPKEIFTSSGECLRRMNVSPKIIDKIAYAASIDNIERYIYLLQKHNDIDIVTYFDYQYPKLLTEIEDPPLVLYYKGDLSVLNARCIAMVGTRDATNKGKYHARSFAQELAAQGYTIVSGMAKGIDFYAHIGALSTGKTCAVLGCGVDVVYPAENRDLYNKICNNGLVLSEFLPSQGPQRWSFPVRNRIISGLCQSTFLVEAPQKSGAINTVDNALEQNRDVFVLYDDSDSKEFAGNRKLIEDGATPVHDPYDIMNNTGFTAYDSPRSMISLTKDPEPISAIEDKIDMDDVVTEVMPQEKDVSLLSDDERIVYTLIKGGVTHFDDIVSGSGLGVSAVGFALTMLEFNGYIEQSAGKHYKVK